MLTEAAAFLEHIAKERRLSAHTVTAYSTDLRQFTDFLQQHLGIEQLGSADHHDIRSWMVSILEDEGMSARSVNRKMSCLRAFYKHLVRIGRLDANPMGKVGPLKTDSPLPLFIEEGQMQRLLDGMDLGQGLSAMRDRLMLDLLYCCGLRRAELIGLRDSDVRVSRSEIKVLGKRNKERLVPISTRLSGAISEYQSFRDAEFGAPGVDGPLLLTDSGKKLYDGFVYRKVNSYLRLVSTLGRVSPHVLRHTFATHMLNNGADLNAIKEILGHSSLAATQVYTHTSIERLAQVHKLAHPRASKPIAP